MVVEITRVLKRPNRTKNYVRHMVVVATWWSGTLANIIVKQKSYKRRYIQNKETLIVIKVVDLIAIREGSCRNNSEKPAKRVRAVRYCDRCGEKGYNSRNYIVEIKDVDNSDTSKE